MAILGLKFKHWRRAGVGVRVRMSLKHYVAVYCMSFPCTLYLVLLLGSTSLPHVQCMACNYTLQVCGNLSIPYPFGMSAECGLPEYRVTCKHNASYGHGELAFLQVGTPSTSELQVLSFSTNTIIVNSTGLKAMPSPDNCSAYGNASLELPAQGPFILSDNNWFVVIGCNSAGSCTTNRSDPISCSTSCYNEFDMPYCNYYACCVNALPPKSTLLEFQGTGIAYAQFPGVCGFSTVLSPSTYKILPEQKGVFGAGQYGLSISWALHKKNCSTAKEGPDYACNDMAVCIDDDTTNGYTCNCTQGYRGDGYKDGVGCEDIDECAEHLDGCEKPPLGMCVNMMGSYNCSCTGGLGSGSPGSCPIPNHNRSLLLPVLLGGLVGAASLAMIFAFICMSRRAYKRRQEREENFRRIGGDQLKSFLFSERELIKATKGFSDDHVLGEGGFGKVYWGRLTTEHGDMKVAIKRAKPKAVEEQVAQMQSFVKEILLLSKTTHKNVVQLLGCCVETSVPLLVYEFVEKGTLQDYLKTPSRDIGKTVGSGCSLWAWRLHIAVETAEALSYLHNMSEPIFHLDMKSANILIDKDYSPKVADFGLSCFLTSDATHLTNQLPAGTFGYVDPEYYHSLHITNKCDVYSFGVILVELISAWPASQGPGAVLAHHFRTIVDMNEEIVKHLKQHPSFIDSRLSTDVDVLASIHSVAELAHRCVAMTGADRPSMQEVVGELRKIQSKNAGKLQFKGSIDASLDHDLIPQELFGANSSAREGAALSDYQWIPSDQSGSSSSLFAPAPILWDHSLNTLACSHSAIIELQQSDMRSSFVSHRTGYQVTVLSLLSMLLSAYGRMQGVIEAKDARCSHVSINARANSKSYLSD